MIQTDIPLKKIFQVKDRIDHMTRTTPVVESPRLPIQRGRQVHSGENMDPYLFSSILAKHNHKN